MSTAQVVAEPVNGEDVRIDLVFVHGLSDDWQSTWKKDRLSWIEEFLPQDIPHARIFTCGFNTQRGSHNHTSHSLQGLQDYEIKRDHRRRPVIFLAHSLAGLVLQAFLQNCGLALQRCTKGIVFFGTPNDIHNEHRRTKFASAMDRIGCSFENEFLSYLGRSSARFPSWLDRPSFAGRVVCFYERLPIIADSVIVEEQSAVLPRSEARGLDANHMNLTTFLSLSDTNYQRVLRCIRRLYCLADGSMGVLLRHSLKASPHGRLSTLPTTPDGCEEIVISTRGNPAIRDMIRLALVAEDQGHYIKARERYQEAVNSLERRGHCSPAVRRLARLSGTHAERNFDDENEGQVEMESDSLRGKELPEHDDAAVLFCIDKWACLMHGPGRYRSAELYSRYCSKASIRLFGKGSTSTLLATANWISSMICLGRYQEARNTIRDALDNEDMTGPVSVSGIQLLETFAKLASRCGCQDLAESLLCDVLRKAIYLHGYEHPSTLNRMSELAAVLAQKGNLSSAEALSRRSLSGLEQTLGNDHPDCLRAARGLADYICLQGRHDDAILRHKQILAKQRLRIGNDHPETLLTLRSLGIDFALHQYCQDAEMVLDVAFNSLKACFGPNDQNTVLAASALNIVKQSQEEQALEEGAIQTKLLGIFAPQPNPTFQREILNYTCGISLFQSPDEGELLQAVINNNEVELRSILVKKTANEDILGRALREAAASAHEPSVNLLLDFDAPVNAQSGYHGSALQAASLAGSRAIVELLLEHKADPNQEGGMLGNALRAAVFGGHETILCLLLTSAPACGLSPSVLATSMQLALRKGNLTMIAHLIEAGANVNAEDMLFGSPLQQAAFHGQQDIVTLLLDHKAEIERQGGIFTTPLRAAIETQNESAISLLLGAGAIIRSRSPPKLPDQDEQKQLAKILLNRLADSLPYRPLASTAGSHDCLQISKQPVMSWAEHRGRSDTVNDAGNPSSVPMIPESPRPPTRVSTMKRMFEFQGGGTTDVPNKPRSMRKGRMKKPKRTLSQFFGRKPSMQV
ncbi:MAG: hypothetical protein Q9169_006622 [Polycauliona sp. 2 TL-2023]